MTMVPDWLVRDAEGVLVAKQDLDVAYPEGGASAMLEVEDQSFWFSHRNEIVLTALDRFAPPRATVWDVGGGNGFQAKALQSAGRDVVLVEPGAVGCRNAIQRGVKTVIRGTLESLRLPDASLDAITLLDVVEHIREPISFLAECRRVLSPIGKILVTVPAFELLWSDEDDWAEHQRRYTPSLLRNHAEAASLRVEHDSFFFGALIPPIFALRAVPYKLGRKRKEPNLAEHQPGGLAQAVVDRLLRRELAAFRAGKRLRLGSSILGVLAR